MIHPITPALALAVGQFVDVDSDEIAIVAIVGRWVRLANGQSISRATALEFRCEVSDDEADEGTSDDSDGDEADAEGTCTPEGPEGQEEADEDDTGYQGSMIRLRERLAEGAYQKAPNGQPCCGDQVATLLGTLAPAQVIQACIIAMALPANPYTHLNVGQQSMNLRNKLRGCFKREEFGLGVLVEAVETVREDEAAVQAEIARKLEAAKSAAKSAAE